MDTIEVLKQYVNQELLAPPTQVDEDDNLLTDGGVDSLGMMRFITFIEATFNLDIPPEDVIIENFFTIGAIATYLARRQGTV